MYAAAVSPALLLVVLHVIANLVWIGSILATAVIAVAGGATPEIRGALARRVYARLAAPAFGVSFLAGFSRLLMTPKVYLVQTHWMHAKLAFALAVIALHHIIGARVRRMESGTAQTSGPVGTLAVVLFVCALGAVFFVIVRPF